MNAPTALHRRTFDDGSVLVGSARTEFTAASRRSFVAGQTRGSSNAGQNDVFGSSSRTHIKNTLNRATIRIARSGRGPFTLVRHIGRKTGTTYETPIIVARVPDGFVAELTYGPEVSWYRNIVAAGGCVIVFQGAPYQIAHIEPYNTQAGLRAVGYPRALILKALRRNEFRHFRC
jgi:deazaflavin-dependent oxidoreductase (nitroreductase family)